MFIQYQTAIQFIMFVMIYKDSHTALKKNEDTNKIRPFFVVF